MHAFLIAMSILGGFQFLGMLYELHEAESITWPGIVARFIIIAFCGWAVVLLAQGH